MSHKKDYIPVNIPKIPQLSKSFVEECMNSGWISTGRFVTDFEEAISKIVSKRFGIAVTNGTTALDISLTALNLQPGDEVILPNFTIVSCLNQLIRMGVEPIFVDADPKTWNMDVGHLEDAITSRTKAIIVAHIYGLPTDIDTVIQLCEKYGLFLVEDCAEVLGLEYKGRKCGTFGDLSTFSFYSNKIITTGEGGMIATNDSSLAEQAKSLRNLYFDDSSRFNHKGIGWNSRLTNIQAALGCGQIPELESLRELKRRAARLYREGLSDLSENFIFQANKTDYAINDYWVVGILLQEGSRFDQLELMKILAEEGIQTRPFFKPLHSQPFLEGKYKNLHYPVSELLGKNGLYLPSGNGIQDWQIERVIDSLREIFS
jgi:perosamine synthetase